MAIVITKKLRTILLIVLGVLVLGGGGYLLWRVNQPDTVAPEESDAGSCVGYTYNGVENCTYYGTIPSSTRCCNVSPYGICTSDSDCGAFGECGGAGSCNFCINGSYQNSFPAGCYVSAGGCWMACKAPIEEPPDYCVAEYPDYNALPYTTAVATQKSELIIYYRVIPPYTSLAQFIIEDPDGQEHTVNASTTQDRIATGIILESGETATVTTVYDSPGSKASVGWQSVNSGNTCGSGAMGPIQNNDCERYEKKDVSSYISWANSSTDETVISRQCWADAKEWEGDYDFEDFFVQLAYLPIDEPVTCGNGLIDDGEDCDPGITGENGQCQGDDGAITCPSTCVCPVIIQTNPDWTIEKDVEGEYVIMNGDNYANVNYTVVVTNIGDGEGNIDKIIDALDEKVLEDYMQSTSDDGIYSSGSITWDLEGEDEVFDPNESLELTYSLQIPESAYGTYQNTVTAYPTEGDNFSDNATITLASDEEEPTTTTTIPQTGVLDTVIGRISLGFTFIFLGGLVSRYSRINYLFNSMSNRNRFKRDIRRRQKFERKIKK